MFLIPESHQNEGVSKMFVKYLWRTWIHPVREWVTYLKSSVLSGAASSSSVSWVSDGVICPGCHLSITGDVWKECTLSPQDVLRDFNTTDNSLLSVSFWQLHKTVNKKSGLFSFVVFILDFLPTKFVCQLLHSFVLCVYFLFSDVIPWLWYVRLNYYNRIEEKDIV